MYGNVTFSSSDEILNQLYNDAEEKCRKNLKDFAGRKVLVEGGGYDKIWLETQPMGGAMYAKRDMEAALNNQLLFIENQREDGRLPGSIALIDGKVVPQFNKIQGFCFPDPALDVYYLSGRDKDLLISLYDCLRRFDDYLWRVRDSDGDGCLESWCRYDTGEDNALRYGDAPDAWEEEYPPKGLNAVPMASTDFMSYSYNARATLAVIAGMLSDEAAELKYKSAASTVREKIKSYLWDDERGSCFDRNRDHEPQKVLYHNTLRAMYWGALEADDGKRFVREHLLNKDEFWTRMPLPSVAINDPLFRNIKTNNWSGQVEALTYQRAIRALENYGFYCILPKLGMKLFEAIAIVGGRCHDGSCRFVQQYDPFTMEPSVVSLEGEMDAYGPAMLSVLEYIGRMYGIEVERDHLIFGTLGRSIGTGDEPIESEYSIGFSGREYRLKLKGGKATAFMDGKEIFTAASGMRIETDLCGRVRRADSYFCGKDVGYIKEKI